MNNNKKKKIAKKSFLYVEKNIIIKPIMDQNINTTFIIYQVLSQHSSQ